MAAEPRFDLVETSMGVITHPVMAMRRLAEARPWPTAAGLAILIGVLTALAVRESMMLSTRRAAIVVIAEFVALILASTAAGILLAVWSLSSRG